MTFRCTRHFFSDSKKSRWYFVVMTLVVLLTGFFEISMYFLTAKSGMSFVRMRHCYFLLLCLFGLQRRGWLFLASATIFCFFVCLFWLQKEWILFCVASDNIMHSSPFAAIFSDDISLHPPLLFFFYVCLFSLQNVISALVCLFWSQKRGRQFVASVTFLVCLFWLQKTQWYLVSLGNVIPPVLIQFVS